MSSPDASLRVGFLNVIAILHSGDGVQWQLVKTCLDGSRFLINDVIYTLGFILIEILDNDTVYKIYFRPYFFIIIYTINKYMFTFIILL